MRESFANVLSAGGHANSLGRTDEVIDDVLADKCRLAKLYECVFHEDAWVRMRAMDAIEKIGREKPDWLLPYIDKFQSELADNAQASIQWHLSQIYAQIPLTTEQKQRAIVWLKNLLSSADIDWIASVNAMKTLVQFTRDGSAPKKDALSLLQIQTNHTSKTVVKTSQKLIAGLQV